MSFFESLDASSVLHLTNVLLLRSKAIISSNKRENVTWLQSNWMRINQEVKHIRRDSLSFNDTIRRCRIKINSPSLEASGGLWENLGPLRRPLWSTLIGLFWASFGLFGPLWASLGLFGPLGVSWDLFLSLGASWCLLWNSLAAG